MEAEALVIRIFRFLLLLVASWIVMTFTHEMGHILDTPKLLEHGASPITIAVYCLVTIGFGYVGFRQSCISVLKKPTTNPRRY